MVFLGTSRENGNRKGIRMANLFKKYSPEQEQQIFKTNEEKIKPLFDDLLIKALQNAPHLYDDGLSGDVSIFSDKQKSSFNYYRVFGICVSEKKKKAFIWISQISLPSIKSWNCSYEFGKKYLDEVMKIQANAKYKSSTDYTKGIQAQIADIKKLKNL